jgi:hypothetical protein
MSTVSNCLFCEGSGACKTSSSAGFSLWRERNNEHC